MSYYVGDTLRYRFTCTNAKTGLPFDPDPCRVSIIRGDGSEDTTVYQEPPEVGKLLERISEGVYELSYVLTIPGNHELLCSGEWSSGGATWPGIQQRAFPFTVIPNQHTNTDVAAP